MWRNQWEKNILDLHWATGLEDRYRDCPDCINVRIPLAEEIVESEIVSSDIEIACSDGVIIILRENCDIAFDNLVVLSLALAFSN